MTDQPAPNAGGEPPPWAVAQSGDDDSVTEFSRALGEVRPVDDQPFRVSIVQFEEVDLTTTPITVTRTSPQLRINGYRYSMDEAAILRDVIATGLRMVETRRSA